MFVLYFDGFATSTGRLVMHYLVGKTEKDVEDAIAKFNECYSDGQGTKGSARWREYCIRNIKRVHYGFFGSTYDVMNMPYNEPEVYWVTARQLPIINPRDIRFEIYSEVGEPRVVSPIFLGHIKCPEDCGLKEMQAVDRVTNPYKK